VELAALEVYLGRPQAAADLLLAARQTRIASQVAPDGRQPHELARTRSLSYSTMNLIGFANLAAIGERVGADLWHWSAPDGRSIRAALNWLMPYAAGQLPWAGPQITPVDPAEFVPLYRRAALAYGDPRYTAVLETIDSGVRQQHLANLIYG
jgi:hypothetical protein